MQEGTTVNSLRIMAALTAMTVLLLAAGAVVGGSLGMTVMLVVAILLNGISYWFSDQIVLGMYGARLVDAQAAPELLKTVTAVAQKAKMPLPAVYLIDTPVPNAFAAGRNPQHAALAVTTGLRQLLSAEELEAVLAHEMAHIKQHDTLISTIVASLAGMLTMMAHMVHWLTTLAAEREKPASDHWASMLEMLLLIILAPIAAAFIQMGISRRREFAADATSAAITGNPLALIQALYKIENHAAKEPMPEATPATAHLFIVSPFSTTANNWLLRLFSTHPTTTERILRLHEYAKRSR